MQKFSWEMTEAEKAEAAAAKAAALDEAFDYLAKAIPDPRPDLDKCFGKGNYRIVYPPFMGF